MNRHLFSLASAAALALCLGAAGLFVSCSGGGGEGDSRVVNVTGLSLNRSVIELAVNEEERLVATIIPSNATDQSVAWSSDNRAVASVINGRVKGEAPGTARITATSNNGNHSAQCDVYVINVPVTGMALDKTGLTLIVGNTDVLTTIFQPANASNKNVTWNSSNPNVVRVEPSGTTAVVRGMAPGTANITVTAQEGNRTGSCAITVLAESDAVRVTGVSLNKTQLTLSVGGSETLSATVQPANATNRSVSWFSSNPGVASVVSGTVTALSEGSTTITVTTSDGGMTANCAVTVMTAIVPVTGVTLNKTSLTLNVGTSETLVPAVQPSNATNQSVSWSSSNTGIATVSTMGLVTAVATGSATITVTTNDGNRTANCYVTVPPPPVDVYVAGTVGGSNDMATLWKNGTAQTLSYSTSAANSVFVSGQDVYVAGRVGSGTASRATLWKNGTAQTLGLSGTVGVANDVFVVGNNVYAAGITGADGFSSGSSSNARATLWRNGSAEQLATTTSYALSVYVSGSDVYVAGVVGAYGSSSARATLWKNGAPQTLPSSTMSYAYSVFVSGSDVYVAGMSETNKATLWKNGAAQVLSTSYSWATGVFVSGSDVYVAGTAGSQLDNQSVRRWKNGVEQQVSNNRSVAAAIYVYGDDVYVAGRQTPGYTGMAALWKNQTLTVLSQSASEANSVFVRQQ